MSGPSDQENPGQAEMPAEGVVSPVIDAEVVTSAEKVIGLSFTEAERQLMLEGLNETLAEYENLRAVHLENDVPPAFAFDPRLPGMQWTLGSTPGAWRAPTSRAAPSSPDELAFLPVTQLAALLRRREVSSEELTRLYIERLKRFDPALKAVVTLTEDLALAQARRADAEIATGSWRGPLHGIPWGVKDLFAVRDYPTTWGAVPYKDQVIDRDAAVVRRLAEAGAVLIAKLTTGALAYGDVWFGGTTKSPWDLEQGSSGSSAGPAAATAAGLVGFSIGTETLGSIVSPSIRCGVTGLRPTFGRVSRHGVMALSWSMDKIGPICRSVEDCALVFQAILGPDGLDPTVADIPFQWGPEVRPTGLRLGYVERAFQEEREGKAYDDRSLAVLEALGFTLTPIALPDYPYKAMFIILVAEAAAAFDELTRSGADDMLVRQDKEAWPNAFRQARLIPAVEYIQANRIRTLAMRAMAELMARVDVYVCPAADSANLFLTNFTGHPAVVVPNGFTEEGKPASGLSFIGGLYREAEILAVAKAYQDATDFHLRHPELEIPTGGA